MLKPLKAGRKKTFNDAAAGGSAIESVEQMQFFQFFFDNFKEYPRRQKQGGGDRQTDIAIYRLSLNQLNP